MLQRDIQNAPKTNPYRNIPDDFTLSKHTPTARRRLKEFIEILPMTPRFVQDLGFLLPGIVGVGLCLRHTT
ncbi:hypothetical protein [Nodularia sp. NIES-3585]|uniref:hypothetical protein n=1 Tax=Nodularia sp. NIES-3585 TaxID=1973477 RepID=UPI0011311DC0|nr:hypothetical protein [Nodularia sp. NIES-3585]